MPLVYVWNVPGAKDGEKGHEVRLELGLLGRERVRLDGATVSDSYSLRLRRRIPLALGAGHSAGVEFSMERVIPEATLSVDGKIVEPVRRPRVPLWGWAFALVSAGIFFVPVAKPDLIRLAARGLAFGVAAFLCLYASASESVFLGFVSAALCAAALWGAALAVK